MLLRDLLHDREAEARAARLAARDERLEEAVLDVLRDAAAGVRDNDDKVVIISLDAYRQHTATLGHRLDRVADEVAEEPLHLDLVEPGEAAVLDLGNQA